ncbi:MAG TPA: FHA domain-containing protein [Solirubrobacterales bacterium]|nr:FHA domain-containing protein [Solirubrobacterales bacterium]
MSDATSSEGSGPPGPKPVTASELKAQIEAERRGEPFLVHRDGAGELQTVVIDRQAEELWVGRASSTDLRLDWDREVSGLHAQLERIGDDVTLVDDGLSRNGSYVNGERITGRRRLRDGDVLRFGRTSVLYRAPAPGRESLETLLSVDPVQRIEVSPAQRRVLVALCRPFKEGAEFTSPATNQQIAAELHLSVEAVKTHLRALFERFELADVPQNRKRVELAKRALQSGVISEHEL